MTISVHGLEWRRLVPADIPQLLTFAPEEWHIDLGAVLLQHVGRPYFHGLVASTASGIVALGQAIATGRTGWLGNIIVRPDARSLGLGTRMTRELIAWLGARGCASTLLVATPLGEPVYLKLGFRGNADYVFLDVPPLAPPGAATIVRLEPSDFQRVLALDASATGELRADLLSPHLPFGWRHRGPGDLVDGFFLPSFGAGLIVSSDPAAGCALLQFKHALRPGGAVVPSGNAAALSFLLGHGARETGRAPRMVLGEEPDWRPERVFARAAGYCG